MGERRVALVTGASDGIGLETAAELSRRDWRVLVHGRSTERAEQACEKIRTTVKGADVVPVAADLGSLAAVRSLAAAVGAAAGHLDVLINNAGVFMKEFQRSADGHELTFAVNHLAHFLLTHELRPLLRAGTDARVVNVSSMAHSRGRLDLRSVSDPARFDDYGAYAHSKLCNVMFAVEAAPRLQKEGITSNALHPGVVGTKLLRAGFGSGGYESLKQGAATSVLLATDEKLKGVTGRYFAHEREAPMNPAAQDAAQRAALWALSEQLCGIHW